METVFLKLLNMSINAGWLVLAVVLLRLLLKKAPRWINCILWAFVAFRLICPFTIESALSLLPSREVIPSDIVYQQSPEINTGIGIIDSSINPALSESMAPTLGNSVNPLQIVGFIATAVWITGMAIMVIYTAVSYIRLRLKVRESVQMEGDIRLCDRISTPFILGIIRPKIYLPSNMASGDTLHVISHEKAHLKRKDHWWKPVGFALLTVYWFNPLMWVAYILLCRDIEAACDEKVVGAMSEEDKKTYSDALLNCSVSRKTIAACPLAFGETGVKSRIKSVLSYKRPAFWIIIVSLVICGVVAVCFLTNPPGTVSNQKSNSNIDGVSLEIVNVFPGEEPAFEIRMVNKSEDAINYGEINAVYRKVDGQWEELSGLYHYLLACDLPPGESSIHTQKFPAMLFSEPGEYKFECDISVPDKKIINKRAWVEFRLKESISNLSYYIDSQKCTSDNKDVSLKITGIGITGERPSLNVQWINKGDTEVTFGEAYTIYRKEKNGWVEFKQEKIFNALAYIILSKDKFDFDYDIGTVDLSLPGDYRLECEFGQDEKVRVDFHLKRGIACATQSEVGGVTGPTNITQISAFRFDNKEAPLDGASLILNHNNKGWQFSCSTLSSKLHMGYFEIKDKRLYLHGAKDSGDFVFDIADDKLIFAAKESYGTSWDTVPDGAVFEPVKSDNSSVMFSVSLDFASFDLDGDGRDEGIHAMLGNTSGRFTVDFTLQKDTEPSITTTVDMEPGDVEFEETEDGKLQVINNDTVYTVSYKDGFLVISRPDK